MCVCVGEGGDGMCELENLCFIAVDPRIWAFFCVTKRVGLLTLAIVSR